MEGVSNHERVVVVIKVVVVTVVELMKVRSSEIHKQGMGTRLVVTTRQYAVFTATRLTRTLQLPIGYGGRAQWEMVEDCSAGSDNQELMLPFQELVFKKLGLFLFYQIKEKERKGKKRKKENS